MTLALEAALAAGAAVLIVFCGRRGVLLPLAVAAGAVAFFASARSLQLGPGVPVIALTSIAGNAATIPAGFVVFGDPLGGDPLTVALRSAAFACVIVAGGLIPAPRVADSPAWTTRSTSPRSSPSSTRATTPASSAT